MVEFSDDLRDAGKSAFYYSNLLEVRQVAREHHLPFWNAVSCNQIRKFTPPPSPANLAFQAYTTLARAAGRPLVERPSRRLCLRPDRPLWPQDGNVAVSSNGQSPIRTLGPIMNRLESTGVYFSSLPPAKSLPLLPGRIVKQVLSRPSVRGKTDADHLPVMVGEFKDEHGGDYVMLVNLGLVDSKRQARYDAAL